MRRRGAAGCGVRSAAASRSFSCICVMMRSPTSDKRPRLHACSAVRPPRRRRRAHAPARHHVLYMYMFIGGVLDSPTHNALTNGTHTKCSHVRPTALTSCRTGSLRGRESVQSWPPSRLPLQPAPDLPLPRGCLYSTAVQRTSLYIPKSGVCTRKILQRKWCPLLTCWTRLKQVEWL